MITREEGRTAFGAAALDYHAARPPYPAGVFDGALRGRDPTAATLIDVGAGNGLAAQGFIDRGVENVTFLEPDARFRPFLERRSPSGRFVHSTLEEATFSEAFDIAVVGTAWHWLDPATRMASVAAALRPGGCLVLVWNLFRDVDRPDHFHDATTWIFDALPGQREAADRPLGATDRGERMREFVSDGRFSSVSFDDYRWSITLSTEGVRTLYSGFSPIQRLSSEDRQWTLDRLADVAERKFDGEVVRHMTTACYTGTLRW